MAINYELIYKGAISLGGGNFEPLSAQPLDSRTVVPTLAGLQNYIDNGAAYAGMIVYDEETKKHYEVKVIDGVLSYREFGLTQAELEKLITDNTTAAMEFKGATAVLPENPAKGDMYKVAGENINIKIDNVDAKLGDSIVYDGSKWFLIPSGDDIEDTWRPVTGVNNDAALTFAAGAKLDVAVAAEGTITYSHETVAAPELLAENEQTRTYITSVETDGYGHITGYKTATENVVDTDTTYTFESQVEESSVYFQVTSSEEGAEEQTIYVDAYSKNEADGKFVAKEGYIAYSQTEKDKLAGVSEGANKVENVGGGKIKIDGEEVVVYAHPEKHAISEVDGLQGALDGKSDIGHKHVKEDITDFAHNHEISEVNGLQDALNDKAAEEHTHTKSEITDFAHIHEMSEINGLNDAIVGVREIAEAAYVKPTTGIAKTDLAQDVQTSLGLADTALQSHQDISHLAVKADVETELGKKVDKTTYEGKIGELEEAIASKQAAGDYSEVGHKHVKADITDFAHTHVAADITDLDTTIKGYNYATKGELEGVDGKFANYKPAADQKAIDDEQDRRLGVIEGDYLKAADIANFETKENVKKVADDLAAHINASDEAFTAIDAKFGDMSQHSDIGNDLGTILGVMRQDNSTLWSEFGQYVTSNNEALAAVKEIAEAARTEAEVDDQIDAKIAALNLGDTYTTEQEVKDIVDGVIASAADKETYNSLTKLVDYIDAHGGEASEMASAIDTLEGKVEVIEGKPAYGITATQISNWDGEVGAKALANTKTTAAEVKAQIEAYGYATTGELASEKAAREAKEAELASAIEAAKTEAANQDAVVLSEAQKYADQAEADAVAAAEGKVNALAATLYTKEQVDALLATAFTWGEF